MHVDELRERAALLKEIRELMAEIDEVPFVSLEDLRERVRLLEKIAEHQEAA